MKRTITEIDSLADHRLLLRQHAEMAGKRKLGDIRRATGILRVQAHDATSSTKKSNWGKEVNRFRFVRVIAAGSFVNHTTHKL